MNNLVLVGRLVKRPVLEETEIGRKTTTIVLAVSRNFKNDVGEYETDFIPVNLVGQVAESTVEYLDNIFPSKLDIEKKNGVDTIKANIDFNDSFFGLNLVNKRKED